MRSGFLGRIWEEDFDTLSEPSILKKLKEFCEIYVEKSYKQTGTGNCDNIQQLLKL